jgi:hypothetical protein
MSCAHRLRNRDVPQSLEIGVPHNVLRLIVITIAVAITIASLGSTDTNRGRVSPWEAPLGPWSR